MATGAFPVMEDFVLVLEDCLEQLDDEQETVDSILNLYPRFYDQLRPPLEAAAWLYSKKNLLNPRPEFIPISRTHLVNCLSCGGSTYRKARKIRGGRPRLLIRKDAVIFSLVGTSLITFLD